MMPILTPYPFDETLLPLVQDFECGSDPWAIEVSEWIKRDDVKDCAVQQVRRNRCRVWLYYGGDDALIGYGSLGSTRWVLQPEDKTQIRTAVHIIPFLGVQTAFQGKPEGPPEGRYAYRILRHLLIQAGEVAGVDPIIGLFVDKLNVGA